MRLPAIGLVIVIVLAVAAALWTIGGPEQARAERRDMTRWQDLQALAWHIDCLLLDGKAISELSDTCPNPPRTDDPYSGNSYVVDQVTDRHITLCTTFETDLSRLAPYISDQRADPERGCVVIRRQGQT